MNRQQEKAMWQKLTSKERRIPIRFTKINHDGTFSMSSPLTCIKCGALANGTRNNVGYCNRHKDIKHHDPNVQ